MMKFSENTDVAALERAWQEFNRLAGLRAIRSDADYDHAVALMNRILDAGANDDAHPLRGLLALLADMVAAYDDQHFSLGRSEPREILAFLMEQGELSASDLAAVVNPAELTEILSGQRTIDLELATKLGACFHNGPELFLGKD